MSMPNFYHNTIAALLFPFERPGFRVGEYGVTAITEESANGQMAEVPWFSIQKGDKTVAMVNAAHVAAVEYVTTPDENVAF